jgi:hypothetical protein
MSSGGAAETIPKAVKFGANWADVVPMGVSPGSPTWQVGDRSLPTAVKEEANHTQLSDEQLISERDRLRSQLDELTENPGSSPVVGQMLVNIDQKIDRMTDELTRRALSRNPSSPDPSSRMQYRSAARRTLVR